MLSYYLLSYKTYSVFAVRNGLVIRRRCKSHVPGIVVTRRCCIVMAICVEQQVPSIPHTALTCLPRVAFGASWWLPIRRVADGTQAVMGQLQAPRSQSRQPKDRAQWRCPVEVPL